MKYRIELIAGVAEQSTYFALWQFDQLLALVGYRQYEYPSVLPAEPVASP